jgi:NAD(P)-dependent dehydrogenase (short-subunit alcohol dehydrogenase family)
MGRLEGKTALITGGASGIGLAAAQAFVREGAKVMLVDRDQAALDAAAGKLDAVARNADTSDPEAVQAFVREAADRLGGLDIAVLNAGVGSLGVPLDGYPIEEFDRVVGINLRGVWTTLRECVRVMKPRGTGSIIVTGSIHSHAARTLSSPYTTAKAGLYGMVKGAALEMANRGVRVNMVAPGFIDTPLLRGALNAIVPKNGVSGRDALARNIPMRRLGSPEEIAEVMLFLASDEASYTTGASFAADGGILAAWGPTPD